MRVGAMRGTLGKAVKAGKCNSPTGEIIKLENFLKEKYSTLNTQHIASLVKTRQAEFDVITDITSAASYSIPLFLRRYFLNDDGSPNPIKTVHPIVLPLSLSQGWGMMYEAASKIKGLHTCYAGREPNVVFAMGWDREATLSAADKAAVELIRKLESEEDEERPADQARKDRMEEHRDFFTSQSEKKTTRSKGKTGKDFELSEVVGRYLVESLVIEEQWPDNAESGLSMKIVPDKENTGRLMAKFEFGILEGVMRFSQVGEEHLPDKNPHLDSDLEEDAGGTEVDSYLEGDNQKEEEEEDSQLAISFMSDIDDRVIYNLNIRKRKREASPPPPAKKQRGKPTSKSESAKQTVASTPQIQKPRISTTGKFKLLFFWRGRETGEGEIQVDYDRSNKGYIEFDNTDCTTFTGIMNSPYFSDAELKGYKVAKHDGRGINFSWEEFSGEA